MGRSDYELCEERNPCNSWVPFYIFRELTIEDLSEIFYNISDHPKKTGISLIFLFKVREWKRFP